MIRACGVGVSYGSVRAVSDMTLSIAPGLTVLSGPSGSGKSTLLRVLSLVERPSTGEVFVREVPTSAMSWSELRSLRRKEIAVVFQNPADNLIAHLTVGENLRAAGATDLSLLDRLGLGGSGTWRIGALSGGQQQRLAFGCALARGASVVVADEPTSQLDVRSADLVLETLSSLPVPAVVASHDPRLVALADLCIPLAAS
ncbi:ABC transporter ATP-binding protein [Lentzea aerocolonigenes]|uniref:ABC transporter ATP-binding protein n=1 Tax=Lentzea aerocolonigenes TaxID=68170 RepID=UPI000A8435A2|nr:ATP-binding cassette domain-containing protein [Lentzea aerocolonigenes]MCP2251165.1 macrolide transport system ATP-binding/permease protein [Lentzea aerocolonigenes]